MRTEFIDLNQDSPRTIMCINIISDADNIIYQLSLKRVWK